MRTVHQGKDFGNVQGQRFVRETFDKCRFTGVRGAKFIDCDVRNCCLDVDNIQDLLGITVTLDCLTFDSLKLSPLAFDAFLFLLSTTEGNDEKRERIRSIIEPHHLSFFDRAFKVWIR